MKEKITVINREYNEKGDLIKETETITEKEYKDYTPLFPTIVPYNPIPQPINIYYDNNPYTLTCNCKVGD
jgi:hypothetical protein